MDEVEANGQQPNPPEEQGSVNPSSVVEEAANEVEAMLADLQEAQAAVKHNYSIAMACARELSEMRRRAVEKDRLAKVRGEEIERLKQELSQLCTRLQLLVDGAPVDLRSDGPVSPVPVRQPVPAQEERAPAEVRPADEGLEAQLMAREKELLQAQVMIDWLTEKIAILLAHSSSTPKR